ncbi:MAG: DNA double-strand break repair nuclease NurA, partial [Acidobacteriota bacterium]|nr:DNA double-strand break repair nuclease NurA [Acidobacteriota bacterium]
MLHKELLAKELVSRREDFAEFASLQAVDIDLFLKRLVSLTHDPEILELIRNAEGPGAIPSEELYSNGAFSVPFGTSWSNHEESRDWAAGVLDKRTTFAADGSQLYVERETSLPVGAVQIGWFENPHDTSKGYEKNVSFELLTPKALLEDQEEPLNPETRVGERRFHAEVERTGEFLEKHRGWRENNERMPVAFFDGTLLVSFSLPQTSLQQSFLMAMLGLVAKSQETGVPLVGYVDRSFAKDIVTMIGILEPSLSETTLYDTTLLSTATTENKRLLKQWGDRSIYCESK